MQNRAIRQTKVLSEFMTIVHPDLPSSPSPYFTTADLCGSLGISKKSVEDWLESGLLRTSISRGAPGRTVTGESNYHKFSKRDLLVASCISCLPSRAVLERRHVSVALYAATSLHRYILITSTSARLFDSLRTFADPVEWSSPILHIIDLRSLWDQIIRKYAKMAIKRKSISRIATLDHEFASLSLPSGENARRKGL